MCSTHAWRRTVTVWLQTPSTASTRTTAPSHSREAVETSLLKSMWPGESIRFIRYSFCSGSASAADLLSMEKYREIAEDSMVIPLNCSSGLESRYRIFPASLGEMMPLVAIRASVSEVFPWSYFFISESLRSQDLWYLQRELIYISREICQYSSKASCLPHQAANSRFWCPLGSVAKQRAGPVSQ